MRWRYAGRGTEGRSRLLDEVCEVCGYERKYAIKLMNRRQPAPKRKAGRKRVYAQEVAAVVKAIWLHSEQPCGKRLKELLPLWLPHYQRREGRLGKDVRQQVLKASAATLDRMLSPYRSAHPKRWRVPKPGTLIKLMTDGILLAETQHDRLLRRYDTLIIDEAHERSLNIDFLLGYMSWMLPQRPDFRLVITSATIDPERFSRHFGNAPIINVSGRSYPVELRYRPVPLPDDEEGDETEGLEQAAIIAAVNELWRDQSGDILIF